MYQLGCHTDLKLPIQKTSPALDILPGSFGCFEGLPLLTGFNTKYGSCVPTAICNYVRIAFARAGRTDTLTDQTCLDVYTAVTGFNQNDPTTDNGTDPEAMLTWFLHNQIGGASLRGFTRIDHTDEQAIRNSIVKTGAVFLVFQMSVEQQNQTEWFPVGTPGSWGGHGISGNSYAGSAYYVITWGTLMPTDRSYMNANGFVVGAYELDIVLPEAKAEPTMTPQEVLARTLWGEARGDGKDGMQAVANVVVNITEKPGWWGHDISTVCLAPWQFSCWLNEPVGEKEKLLAVTEQDPQYQIALNLAQLAIDGILPDTTKGATSYYAISMPNPPVFAKPENFTVQIGQQKFYRD